ncbi:MAG: ABC transporter ATP-binding protein [Candidatus Krumholzibacteriota bacterium]|nr:ABC transporter ATP-binding protein [Candidatus Krumholzibacteriota bacterium]
MGNILEAKKLRKEYKTFTLDGVSLSIPKGGILGLIGPNGSGKTTTIRILMNMVLADSGRVEIFGLKHPESEREIKDRIGYVGEEQFYYEHKKVSWTGKFVSQFFSRWDQGIFNGLLDKFGIDPGIRIKNLSKGNKVKLSIAIALSHHPQLLVLDEPTAGLDPVIRREVLEKLLHFRGDEERSVLISSHITDDIMRVADQVAFIVEGRIALNRGKDDILANWKRIHFKAEAIEASLRERLFNLREHVFGNSGVTREYTSIQEALVPGIEAGDIKIENASLDDILIAFVKGKKSCLA